jgi:hypothetical protein
LAGIFLQFAAGPARLGITYRCNSSALSAEAQIPGLTGAGNSFCPGKELRWLGQ